jgi:hypothetical protein
LGHPYPQVLTPRCLWESDEYTTEEKHTHPSSQVTGVIMVLLPVPWSVRSWSGLVWCWCPLKLLMLNRVSGQSW